MGLASDRIRSKKRLYATLSSSGIFVNFSMQRDAAAGIEFAFRALSRHMDEMEASTARGAATYTQPAPNKKDCNANPPTPVIWNTMLLPRVTTPEPTHVKIGAA